jgi:hypothetical protein
MLLLAVVDTVTQGVIFISCGALVAGYSCCTSEENSPLFSLWTKDASCSEFGLRSNPTHGGFDEFPPGEVFRVPGGWWGMVG